MEQIPITPVTTIPDAVEPSIIQKATETSPAAVEEKKPEEVNSIYEDQQVYDQEMEKRYAQANELIKQLDTIDFSDQGKVLDWFVALHDTMCLDETCAVAESITKEMGESILAKFADRGFFPSTNTGAESYFKLGFHRAKQFVGYNFLVKDVSTVTGVDGRKGFDERDLFGKWLIAQSLENIAGDKGGYRSIPKEIKSRLIEWKRGWVE